MEWGGKYEREMKYLSFTYLALKNILIYSKDDKFIFQDTLDRRHFFKMVDITPDWCIIRKKNSTNNGSFNTILMLIVSQAYKKIYIYIFLCTFFGKDRYYFTCDRKSLNPFKLCANSILSLYSSFLMNSISIRAELLFSTVDMEPAAFNT